MNIFVYYWDFDDPMKLLKGSNSRKSSMPISYMRIDMLIIATKKEEYRKQEIDVRYDSTSLCFDKGLSIAKDLIPFELHERRKIQII